MTNLIDKHNQARRQFSRIQSHSRDVRAQCLEDRRFCSVSGAMWEGKLGEQYKNKPKFEMNKIQQSIQKIINEFRNNRITVQFLPADGTKNDKLSDTLNGLYRADEEDSSGKESYDNCMEEGVSGGIGGWRLTPQYEDEFAEDEEEDYQRIRIKPIYEADTSIFWDPDSKEYDKSDANYCYLLTSMDRTQYIEKYQDDPTTWPKENDDVDYDWDTPDIVYIAEYYEIEEETKTRQTWEDLTGHKRRFVETDFERDETLKQRLEATGYSLTSTRKYKSRRVHKYLMSGGKILEDMGYLPGKHIGIIPYYGQRRYISNIERANGHTRLAKDASRLKNMQISKLAEISAVSSVEKPIVTPEQMLGHTTQWQEDNIKNYPYLLLNSMTDKDGNSIPAAPLGYTRAPQIPPALAALLQLTDSDLKDILGNFQLNEDIKSNVSGKAIEKMLNKIDMQTFIYVDNLAKSMKRCGEVWLSMARDLYVEPGRRMKIIGKNNELDTVTLSEPYKNSETGETEYRNDITKCRMSVRVSVGPSSDSKRSATVAALSDMLPYSKDDPEAKTILFSMIMLNMEGEGIEDVREFFRKRLVNMGALKPTEDEQRQMEQNAANKQPNANDQYLQAAALEAQAKAQKAEADTLLTMAKVEQTEAQTDETRAKTLETMEEISTQTRENAVKLYSNLEPAAPNYQANA